MTILVLSFIIVHCKENDGGDVVIYITNTVTVDGMITCFFDLPINESLSFLTNISWYSKTGGLIQTSSIQPTVAVRPINTTLGISFTSDYEEYRCIVNDTYFADIHFCPSNSEYIILFSDDLTQHPITLGLW